MSHRVLLSLLAVTALAMIALSLVWPQGMGRPSPPPFGPGAGDNVTTSR